LIGFYIGSLRNNPHEKYMNVPLELQSGWEACNIRNYTGYKAIALGLVALSATMLTARMGFIRL